MTGLSFNFEGTFHRFTARMSRSVAKLINASVVCPSFTTGKRSGIRNEVEDDFFEAMQCADYFTSLTSKSLLSTLSPILTQISLTVPAPGEATAANIFMASRVAMVSPSLTF